LDLIKKSSYPVVVTVAEGTEEVDTEDMAAEDTEAVGMAAVDMTMKVTWITWYWNCLREKLHKIFQHVT
jgi:hypothetical protein